jgi:hypothetical protein
LTLIPKLDKLDTPKAHELIRDRPLGRYMGRVLLWSGLVLDGLFINWQRGRPTHQDGSHSVESRIVSCICLRSCVLLALSHSSFLPPGTPRPAPR